VTLLYSSRTEKEEAKALNAKFVSMDELLTQSDFVIPLCRLTKETENLMGLEQFTKMKRDAILINVSRGGVINQNDLITALQSKLIGGCGLDVTTPEPLPADSPLLAPELAARVVVLPHIGSASF
jgi:glyoxylate/hydroxypyruvate reductase